MQTKSSKFTITIFSILLIFSLNTAYALDATSNKTLTADNINRVLNGAYEKLKTIKTEKTQTILKL